jgi:hypothetical protein
MLTSVSHDRCRRLVPDQDTVLGVEELVEVGKRRIPVEAVDVGDEVDDALLGAGEVAALTQKQPA